MRQETGKSNQKRAAVPRPWPRRRHDFWPLPGLHPNSWNKAHPHALLLTALIVADYSHHHSHWSSRRSLSQWLTQQKVPALYGLDTRLLTKKIREKGALRARIEFDEAISLGGNDADLFEDVNARNLVAEVSIKEPKVYGKGNKWKVLAIDCGIKVNIIRSLVQRDCEVTLLPWDAPLADKILDHDGIFLSNGPGDPAAQARLDARCDGRRVERRRASPELCVKLGRQRLRHEGRAPGATVPVEES